MMDNRKRLSERYVYLCDGSIIICKMSKKGGVGLVGGGGGGSDLKLRDKHLIRRVDVLDREDTDDLKFTYELVPRDQVLMLLFLLQEGRRKLSCRGTICPFFDIGLMARHSLYVAVRGADVF